MNSKHNAALDLFIESVIKADYELRNDARANDCLAELLNIREDVLEYLYTIRRRKDGSVSLALNETQPN